jgi:hypothetical protein
MSDRMNRKKDTGITQVAGQTWYNKKFIQNLYSRVKTLEAGGGGVTSVNGDTGPIVVLTDEDITGTRLTQTISGFVDIDWSLEVVRDYTLNALTTLSDINLPQGVNAKVLEMVVRGDEAFTPSPNWKPYPSNDDYDGNTGIDNHFVITCINGNAGSIKIFYSLTNIPT